MSSKRSMQTFTGLATARGFASGPAFLYRGEGPLVLPETPIAPGSEDAEVARLVRARATARRDIEALIAALHERTDLEQAKIFESHLLILDDPILTEGAEATIRERRCNASIALRRVTDDLRQQFAQMTDAYFRERVVDLDDVERRVQAILLGVTGSSLEDLKAPSIIVADDLTPSESMRLPRDRVLGFATSGGSATCHVAVLARALGIPFVSGLADITAHVAPGATVLLDGTNGCVTVDPDEASRTAFQRLQLQAQAADVTPGSQIGALADGSRVLLYANAQPGLALDDARRHGAQGIGLYRTEYLWLKLGREPTEEEQFEDYRRVAQFASTLSPESTVTIRTLDIGGDKAMGGGAAAVEANPFLGNRSIRYLLSHPTVFRTQLRAILRASAFGPLCLMHPMVSCIEELVAAEGHLEAVKRELDEKGIAFARDLPVGTMIEVPSAAINAEALARHVSFFSIGTNDLVQYTLAADRANKAVSHLYQPMHPAVLWLVRHVFEAAKRQNVRVAVCGESAADPVTGVLWAAMGADMLSMSSASLAPVSAALSRLSRADLAAYADFVASLDASLPAAEIYAAASRWLAVPSTRTA